MVEMTNEKNTEKTTVKNVGGGQPELFIEEIICDGDICSKIKGTLYNGEEIGIDNYRIIRKEKD
jgi:hypothetical protein